MGERGADALAVGHIRFAGRGEFSLDPEPPRVAGEAPSKPARSAPDRSRLDAAEARLEHVEDDCARGEADFYRRREALETEEAAARRGWAEARKEAQAEVQRERRTYLKSGGKH